MELVPFHRRPGFRTGAGLLMWVAAYAWLRRASQGQTSPPIGLTIALGLLSLLVILIFVGQLIPSGKKLWTYPGEVLRLVVAVLWIALHVAVLLPQSGLESYRIDLTHLDLGLISLFLMVSLAGQFVLPVHSLSERATVIGRLLRYLAGMSGPVMFVHNGRAKETRRERERKGSGVLLVDHASAAVLRTDVRFTGAVGPGVTFTAPGERLAEAVDLRRQIRRSPARKPTTPEEAEEETGSSLAVTKDGIPVSADLAVTFILHPGGSNMPREGEKNNLPPFEFFPAAAGRAVYGHAFSGRTEVPWTKLPLLLVVDLWREQVKGRTLPDLFSASREAPSPLRKIQDEILQRLTSPFFFSLDSGGKRARKPSREFRILKDRGIRVLGVQVSGLVLPDDIGDEHVLRWREGWSGAVHEVLLDAEREALEKRRAGEREAQQALCESLTAGLRDKLAGGETPNRRDTLALLLMDALRVCDRKEMLPEGTTLAAHLSRIRSEVLNLDANCQAPDMNREP
jgi:regulator of protease activity HflC (stomatin/prohibitin superfamily)